MRDAFICDGIRTPIGRYGGALASVRADDLAAIPLRELLSRNPGLDPAAIDDVIFGCADRVWMPSALPPGRSKPAMPIC